MTITRSVTLYLGLLFCGAHLGGQNISFRSNRVTSLTELNSTNLVAYDFNHDGQPDVVVVYDEGLNFYPGHGNGELGSPLNETLPIEPIFPVTADFNGDGNPDILVADGNSFGRAYVLFGNGDGTFQIGPRITIPPGVYNFVVGDFNGDGKQDFLAWEIEKRSVYVELGNGDGTFGPFIETPIGSSGFPVESPIALTIGDFNGDERMDVAIGAQNLPDNLTSVTVLFGDGTGSFPRQRIFPLTFGPESSIGGIAAGDLNGDRTQDLLVTGNNMGYAVLLGDGQGGFQPPRFTSFEGGGTCALGDLNGDGREDLVLANNGYLGGLSFALGNGDGTFQPVVYTYQNPGPFVLSDFNRDGMADVAVLLDELQTLESFTIFMGSPKGLIFAPVIPNTNALWIATGDFNGDGKPDLVASSFQIPTSTTQVFLGDGYGKFTPLTPFQTETLLGVATGDVNNDGILDLVLVPTSTNPFGEDRVAVYLGRGDGTFLSPIHTPAGISLGSATLADFNGDGNLDIAITQSVSGERRGNVLVMLGKGDGTFGTPAAYRAGVLPYAAAAADLDGDGFVDIVAVNSNSNTITLLPGNGNGTFRSEIAMQSGGESPENLTIADVNLDGRPDIVVSNFYGGVVVFLNQGNFTFASFPVTLCGGGYLECFGEGVAVADYNGDGIPDLAMSAYYSYSVAVAAGNGDGTFGPPTLFGSTDPEQLVTGRFFGRALPDIVAASPSGIAVIENAVRARK